MLTYAEQIAQAPHVTPFDWREALEGVRINRLELKDIDAKAYRNQERYVALTMQCEMAFRMMGSISTEDGRMDRRLPCEPLLLRSGG